jgi:hypothetical protein
MHSLGGEVAMPYELPRIFDKQLGRNIEPEPPKPAPKPEPNPEVLPGKRPDPNDLVKTEVYQLYMQGWKPADLEAETGIPAKKIGNWVFSDRWVEQKEYYDRKNSKLRPPVNERPIIKGVVSANRDQRRKDFLEHTGQMAVADAKHWSSMDPQERLVVASEIAALNKVARDNLDLNKEEASNERGHISLSWLTNPVFKTIDATMEVQQIEDAE